jgi:ABC-type phosphate transport system substrate-binding protein
MPGSRLSTASRQGPSRARGSRASAVSWLAYAVLLGLGPATPTAAELSVATYAGTKGTKVTIKKLTREQLRDIFFARQTKWPDGTSVRVFVLPDQHPLHIRFAKETLGVYPYQLRSAWDRLVYSGTGVPPTVVESVEDLRRRIEETPGAIGYIED